MAIIVHDPCPDHSDHLAAEISHQAVITLACTEIIRIHSQFRLFNDISCRRLRTFRYEDCFIQEVLQQLGFTLSETADHIFLMLIARHVGDTLVTHPAKHLKHLSADLLRLVVIAATY